jgi:dolichyl-phosphate beta-glucosyltransferase
MGQVTSIVLPVYNCAANLSKGLAELVPLLDEKMLAREIIIADDGSANPQEIAAIAQQYNCRLVALPGNQGKGAAVKQGILAATGDIIIFMDGDFPFHLSAITTMIEKIKNGKAEVVIGDRTLPQSSYPDSIDPYRKAGSKILSMIISKLYVPGFTDTQCGIKGFTHDAGKRIFKKVTRTGFSFDVEVLFIARKNGYEIHRVPVQVYEQSSSSVRVFKDGMAMLLSLFGIFINNISGKYRINE